MGVVHCTWRGFCCLFGCTKLGSAQICQPCPHWPQYSCRPLHILLHVVHFHGSGVIESMSALILFKKAVSFEWCLCRICWILFNLQRGKGWICRRCRYQANRAWDRCLRAARLWVGVAVAIQAIINCHRASCHEVKCQSDGNVKYCNHCQNWAHSRMSQWGKKRSRELTPNWWAVDGKSEKGRQCQIPETQVAPATNAKIWNPPQKNQCDCEPLQITVRSVQNQLIDTRCIASAGSGVAKQNRYTKSVDLTAVSWAADVRSRPRRTKRSGHEDPWNKLRCSTQAMAGSNSTTKPNTVGGLYWANTLEGWHPIYDGTDASLNPLVDHFLIARALPYWIDCALPSHLLSEPLRLSHSYGFLHTPQFKLKVVCNFIVPIRIITIHNYHWSVSDHQSTRAARKAASGAEPWLPHWELRCAARCSSHRMPPWRNLGSLEKKHTLKLASLEEYFLTSWIESEKMRKSSVFFKRIPEEDILWLLKNMIVWCLRSLFFGL